MAKFETNLKSYIEPVRYLDQVYTWRRSPKYLNRLLIFNEIAFSINCIFNYIFYKSRVTYTYTLGLVSNTNTHVDEIS